MEKRTVIRIIGTMIVLIALAAAAVLGLVMCGSDTPLAGARAATINTIIDQTGVKDRIDSELRSHVDEAAEQTGVPRELIETGIDMLAVKEWEATVLPDDATETASASFDVDGQEVELTTYDDPAYVTVDAYGQQITFEVPKSAQTFTSLVPLVDDAQSLGVTDLLGLM